ncbi:MAG: type II toxin-antitoxin system RelE/ParE family toxin [Thiofilum sp.]|uniref:type II toxin-antitoxin system RelE/ParE family toxin n=1 Tax=Thiofilum sp. TaxID=2212733 RepID=UPI0025F4F62C|nr:type II toxin-antitoxin system RelE/ParE family toxin [Thiofilum sp.]MBK8455329.1 type II toxin-antitoxin system RelE/ParE family toxin [Thiofilum sp.]MBK8455352.1 type II toxin-antitoxin system RelE/ParE family toxin [Thiofilum sp.]
MSYQLTEDAEQDILDIYVYSYREFGEDKAESYYETLSAHFDLLATNPKLGTDFGHVKAQVRRSTCASHSIYYRLKNNDVLILRVLHQSRDPARFL